MGRVPDLIPAQGGKGGRAWLTHIRTQNTTDNGQVHADIILAIILNSGSPCNQVIQWVQGMLGANQGWRTSSIFTVFK